MAAIQAMQTAAERIVNGVTNTAAQAHSSSKTSADSGISSTDFLSLLVSELKNQDPTQPTDPNAYVQQLVGVNSLQQLISINKGVSALDPSTAATNAA